ncbi:hypothetical protein [Streptomyces sp. LN549]
MLVQQVLHLEGGQVLAAQEDPVTEPPAKSDTPWGWSTTASPV